MRECWKSKGAKQTLAACSEVQVKLAMYGVFHAVYVWAVGVEAKSWRLICVPRKERTSQDS